MKESDTLQFIKKLGISVGVGILALGLLLAISSAIALGTGDPDALYIPLSMTSLALSCIVIGGVSAKTCSEYISAFLSSLLAVGVFILVHFLTSLFFTGETSLGIGIRLIIYAGMLLLGLLGGVIGRPRARKRLVRHRRNRR